MKRIIIILILILIILYYCSTIEPFQVNINNNKNCCVIRKQRIGADLVYTYNKSIYCDNYHTNILRTIKEGDISNGKPFTMDKCTPSPKNKSDILGSCRKHNFECVEFLTKSDCKKYPGLVWSEKTCNDRLPYVASYDASFGQPALAVPDIVPLYPVKP
jgi:hypothetical protein